MRPSCGTRCGGSRPGGCCSRRWSCSPRLAYLLGLIDRGRLKEIELPAAGRPGRAGAARPGGARASPTARSATNIMPGARARLAEDKAAGRRLVLATASYRLYAAAIAQRLGFDDVIATDVEYDRQGRTVARDRRAQLLRARQARHDRGLAAAAGARARRASTSASIPTISPTRRSTAGPTKPSPPTPMPAWSRSPSMRAGKCSTGAIDARLRR